MTTKTIVTNGIHMEALAETVEAIKSRPELGKSIFYAHNKWIGGARNTTDISHFYSGEEDHSHPQGFSLDADEPVALGGDELAPNPAEHLLNALASCMTTSLVAHAAVRGIKVHEVECHIEGDVDIQGFLGLDDGVFKGFTDIRVSYDIKADEKDSDKLRELLSFSPILNTLTNGVAVAVEIHNK